MNQERPHIEEHLLLQYLLGRLDELQRAEVESWLDESKVNRAELDRLEALWLETGRLDPPPLAVDTDAAWNKILLRIGQEERSEKPAGKSRFLTYSLRIAAAVIVLLGTFLLIRYFMGNRMTEIRSMYAVVHDTLPDGSAIALNQGSVLSFENFEKSRTVKLSGEASFNIVRDPAKPFTIQAGAAGVRVLGTVFNVNAYPGKEVIVTVYEGKVRMFSTDENDTTSVELEAGTSGILRVGSRTPELLEASPPDAGFWSDRTLEFSGTRLSEVFLLLEKHYHLKITADPGIMSCRLTASFADDPPERIMTVIAESFGLTVTSSGSSYHLSGNGCNE